MGIQSPELVQSHLPYWLCCTRGKSPELWKVTGFDCKTHWPHQNGWQTPHWEWNSSYIQTQIYANLTLFQQSSASTDKMRLPRKANSLNVIGMKMEFLPNARASDVKRESRKRQVLVKEYNCKFTRPGKINPRSIRNKDNFNSSQKITSPKPRCTWTSWTQDNTTQRKHLVLQKVDVHSAFFWEQTLETLCCTTTHLMLGSRTLGISRSKTSVSLAKKGWGSRGIVDMSVSQEVKRNSVARCVSLHTVSIYQSVKG